MTLKITIPQPCHENWGGMTPDEKGRFCSLCAKSVVDFTAMPRSEVESYLMENSNKKICGRFNNSQIDNAPVTLHIPREALYRQTSFRNIFLLALIVSMGTVLFSCQKRTIGEIAIPEGTQAAAPLKNSDTQGPIKSIPAKDSAGFTFRPFKGKVCIKDDEVLELPMALGEPVFVPEPPPLMGDTIIAPGDSLEEKRTKP